MTNYEKAKAYYSLTHNKEMLKKLFLDIGAITEEEYNEIIGVNNNG